MPLSHDSHRGCDHRVADHGGVGDDPRIPWCDRHTKGDDHGGIETNHTMLPGYDPIRDHWCRWSTGPGITIVDRVGGDGVHQGPISRGIASSVEDFEVISQDCP